MIYLEVTQKAGFFSKLWPFGAKKPMTPEEADALQAKKDKETADAAALQARKDNVARMIKNHQIATGDVLREILAKRQKLSIDALEKKHPDNAGILSDSTRKFTFPEGIIETMLQGDPVLSKKEAINRSQTFGMLQNTAMERLAAMEKDDPSLDLSDPDTKRYLMNHIWNEHKTSFRVPSPIVQKLGEAHGLLKPPQSLDEIQQEAERRMEERAEFDRQGEFDEFGGGRGRGGSIGINYDSGASDSGAAGSAPVPTGYRTIVAYHGLPMKDAGTRGWIRRQFLDLRPIGVRKVTTVSPTDWSGVEFHIEHDNDFEAGLKDPSHATGTHPEGHPLALYPKGEDHPPSVYKQQPIYDDTEASPSDTASPEGTPT